MATLSDELDAGRRRPPESPGRSATCRRSQKSLDDPTCIPRGESPDSASNGVSPLRDFRIREPGPSFDERYLRLRSIEINGKGHCRPGYRILYNTLIHEVNAPVPTPADLPEDTWINGASCWTAREKSLLFSHIPAGDSSLRNTRKLADHIGTKSEPEVRRYLELLHQASVENSLLTNSSSPVSLEAVPAAWEIPQSIEDQLEASAAALAYEVKKADIEREKLRHGKHWLLDTALSECVEAEIEAASTVQSRSSSQHENKTLDCVPAAALLHLSNWLELSKLFMSSSADHTLSWVDLIQHNDERPSIYHTAFSDFYNLTVGLTKRIVAAALFQAMSHLRNTDEDGQDRIVREEDVRAACRMLGLRSEWRGFWIGLPRRYKMEVFTLGKVAESSDKNVRGEVLDLAKVEKFLRSSAEHFSSMSPDQLSEKNDIFSGENEETQSDSSTHDESHFWTNVSLTEHSQVIAEEVPDADKFESSFEFSTSDESSSSSADEVFDRTNGSSPRTSLHDRDKAETMYLESLDQQASRKEERRLREVLGVRAGEDSIRDGEADLSRDLHKRKWLEAMEDWRHKIIWRPEWEEFQILPAPEAFQDMGARAEQAKKRRIERYHQP
ncbi:Hypothetical protein D9617_34g041150 [Elsinoe fawcettii]|nr:Hypothetical protein D9617_34g041150 [Elsinoe fawcettii]